MSKRKAEIAVDKDSAKLLAAEKKLFDLQTYAYDLLVSTNATKEGAVKSARAFSDPLLNLELKLLREREQELLKKVAELEEASSGGKGTSSSNSSSSNNKDDIDVLRKENEELRQQVGSVGHQMHSVRASIQDARIRELVRLLDEANKTIRDAKADKETLAGEVFLMKARLKDVLAGKAPASGLQGGGGDDSDSSDSDDEDKFSSFFAAAKGKAQAAAGIGQQNNNSDSD